MIDITYYQKIQNCYGVEDIRDAQKYAIKSDLNRDFMNSLDAYTILINDIERDLTVINTTTLTVKKIKSRPNESFYLGDIIYWQNEHWLITEIDANSDIITYGKMTQCTFKLRWQNSSGNIIERWLAPINPTSSLSGTNENSTLTMGNNYYYFYISTDIETKKLKRDMRFPIDFDDAIEPEIYALDNKKIIGTNYQNSNKGGNLLLTVSLDTFNKDKDKQVTLEDGSKVWIADYISPTPTPTPTTDIIATISGRTTVNIGYSRTYSVSFKDSDGNILSDIIYSWNLSSLFNDKITSTETDGKITLTINDQTLVGQSFNLQVIVDGNVLSQITIQVSQSLY